MSNVDGNDRAVIFLVELLDEEGAARDQEAFASLDGAKGSLDDDLAWAEHHVGDEVMWRADAPGDREQTWWITRMEVKS